MKPDKKEALLTRVSNFAESNVASRGDLRNVEDFPYDLWEEMGLKGLLGIGIPETFGGSGADPLTILLAGETLVLRGRNPGIAFSWLIHQIVGHFILSRFGNDNQKETYLPGMALGKETGCMAISEPSAGARLKEMKTLADKGKNGFILNGEKVFLTNSPLAGFFTVFAVTGEEGGRKRISAFLAPRDAKGLTATGESFFPFLKPCPHGGISLDDCLLGPEALLGEEGKAWENLSIPFRTREDVLLCGLISGGIGRLFELRLSALRTRAGRTHGSETKRFLGSAWSSLDGIRVLSRKASINLDIPSAHGDIDSVVQFARRNISLLLVELEEFVTEEGISPGEEWPLLMGDLSSMTKIAESANAKKKENIGTKLLEEEKFDERFGSTI
ncbi:MAG: acyl-CoA/acyl-ACP dehydrogenase [Syntrophales bacterium]|nr:acyl-CoA/acyl-ACP dehydrogenase [Syntrophales bacterium]